jgi:hypothetical protein
MYREERTELKYDAFTYPRRIKKLLPSMVTELDWELQVLEALEVDCYAKLDSLGVPTEDQNYYVGYTKRLWETALKFGAGTYELEKTSLRNEYLLRGWDGATLDALEEVAQKWAEVKKAREMPEEEEEEWIDKYGVVLLGGNALMEQFVCVQIMLGSVTGYVGYMGVIIIGGFASIQYGSVTIAQGTPS